MAVVKRSLITGITGQTGSYLAELLLAKGYEVFGLVRRGSTPTTSRIAHLLDNPRLTLIDGDLQDQSSLIRAVEQSEPDECYNLAAQSFVGSSWTQPLQAGEITGLGAARVLEALRIVKPDTRFMQASTSELFGKNPNPPNTENTPFYPRSPYGIAKLYAHWMTVNYRESHGMHASCAITHNHESPRRGMEFVTRKVTDGAARIKAGLAESISLGNLDAKRDWGFAGDYVKAMWLMLQQDKPGDYVIATGEAHSIRELCGVAFGRVGLHWEEHVKTDPAFVRPAEVDLLLGDPSLAREKLGWEPRVVFKELVEMMVDADLARHSRPNSGR